MKYKVGDKVRIDVAGCCYDKREAKIRSVDANTGWYALDIDAGKNAWSEHDLIDPHEDCGCYELDDVPRDQYSKNRKVLEVIKWLYINDRKFSSGQKWKEELIKFLEEIL